MRQYDVFYQYVFSKIKYIWLNCTFKNSSAVDLRTNIIIALLQSYKALYPKLYESLACNLCQKVSAIDLKLFIMISLLWSSFILQVYLKLFLNFVKNKINKNDFCVADIAMDWSDHALWWPARNKWLTRTRNTIDQYGVQADALLHFTPMHKSLRVQLPDLRYLDCRVDFSVKTFNAVINLCKELGESHSCCEFIKHFMFLKFTA